MSDQPNLDLGFNEGDPVRRYDSGQPTSIFGIVKQIVQTSGPNGTYYASSVAISLVHGPHGGNPTIRYTLQEASMFRRIEDIPGTISELEETLKGLEGRNDETSVTTRRYVRAKIEFLSPGTYPQKLSLLDQLWEFFSKKKTE